MRFAILDIHEYWSCELCDINGGNYLINVVLLKRYILLSANAEVETRSDMNGNHVQLRAENELR